LFAPALGVKGWFPARARPAVACYIDGVGRLDNIIARNRRQGRMNEKVTTSLVVGAIVLLILGLTVFTDLGLPPEARDARDARDAAPPGAARGSDAAGAQGTPRAPAPDRGTRVDGVLLFTPPAKPARH
jgi:hypothetical protein